MKIVHVISGLNDGGAEAVLYRLCSANTSNVHIVISLSSEGKYGVLLREKGIEVHWLNMPLGRLRLAALVELYRLLRDTKPDVVQTWMYHADLIGGIIARIARIKHVSWGMHNSSLKIGKSRWSTIAVAYVNAFLSRFIPTTIICCADQAKTVHQKMGFISDKFVVIPNGYDINLFKPDREAGQKFRIELGIDENIPLFGLVARFDPHKDHLTLIQSLALVKQRGTRFCCVLVGKDIDANNNQMMAWLKQYDLLEEVLLLGQRNDIPIVMNAIDVHILSSAGEAFPNVICEAMACGTPCITTDVGDAAFIVGNTGWVAAPSNPSMLAEAIQRALISLSDKAEWKLRCVAVRNRIVEHFSLEKMTSAYQSTWGDVVAQ